MSHFPHISKCNQHLAVMFAMAMIHGLAGAQNLPGTLPLQPQGASPRDGMEIAQRLSELPNALEGYQLVTPPATWGVTELTTRLGATAGAFNRFTVHWGTSVVYMLSNDLGTVAVDVLSLTEALEAFGVFIGLQVVDGVPAMLGEEAQWIHNHLIIWQGTYVILLRPSGPRTAVESRVLALAQALSAQLPLPERKPLLVRLMPEARMRRLSLVYWPQEVPDLPMLSRAFSALYKGEIGGARLVLADMGDEAQAQIAYRRLIWQLDDTGLRWPLPGLGAENQVIPDESGELAMLLQRGPYVVALLQVTDRTLGEALLRITLTHINTLRP